MSLFGVEKPHPDHADDEPPQDAGNRTSLGHPPPVEPQEKGREERGPAEAKEDGSSHGYHAWGKDQGEDDT